MRSMDSRLVTSIEFEPKVPRFSVYPVGLSPSVTESLVARGFEKPYRHQADAIEEYLHGNHVVAVTSAGSGKSLIFTAAMLQELESEPMARSLLLFPTKSLAQDQLLKLKSHLEPRGVAIGAYDGDTSKPERRALKNAAQVLLTNPDMLHLAILPNHAEWPKFFRSLRLIVLDEIHAYRGVFGSHVALVLRRLLRICAYYGSHPKIIACSATIGNPAEHFLALTGCQAALAGRDSSGNGRRVIHFYSDDATPEQEAYEPLAATLVRESIQAGEKSLVFCQSRATTERLLYQVRKNLPDFKTDRVDSYRAGYTPKERRAIERHFFKGDLQSLISTNAMELGIDVGELNTVILNGFPSSKSSFFQQIGRAGRGGKDATVHVVARENPVEQFYVHNTEWLFDLLQDQVSIRPDNSYILGGHLRCAAYERPISVEELAFFPSTSEENLDDQVQAGELKLQAGRYYYPSFDAPAGGINLRGVSRKTIKLLCEGSEIGTVEGDRAPLDVHEGATYLHRGETYISQELNMDKGYAFLVRDEPDYYTVAHQTSLIEITYPTTIPQEIALVGLQVTRSVSNYTKVVRGAAPPEEPIPLHYAPTIINTLGLAIPLPPITGDADESATLAHSLEHVLSICAPMVVGCDANDFGSAWYVHHPQTNAPTVFIYDAVAGGIGLSENLEKSRTEWFQLAARMLEKCGCLFGCPRCLMLIRCESSNQFLSKSMVLEYLQSNKH